MAQGAGRPGPYHRHRNRWMLGLELAAILAVSAGTFFAGLGRSDFIKTEGLRAIVAAEMLDRPGLSMPTVHETPYLKKPPLYAWTVVTLARWAEVPVDERLSRLPSAVCATAFLLLLYAVGETCVGRRAGLAAACLAALNVSLVDYGTRAELDGGFAFFATLTSLAAWPALRARGAKSAVWWLAVYAAATAAAFWKGPHALIFLWLMLLTWGLVKKEWRWLVNPGQIVGLAVCLGLLIWWARSLATFAGGDAVAHAAGRELLVRLIPFTPEALVSMLWYGPALVVMSLPASLFVIAGMRRGVTGVPDPAPGSRGAIRDTLGRWWAYLSADPFAEFLLIWLAPNVLFDIVAPAKAPRYALAHFAPIFLLAGWVLHRVEAGRSAAEAVRKVELAWRGLYGVLGMGGAAALVIAGLVWALPERATDALGTAGAAPWMIVGLAAFGLAVAEYVSVDRARTTRRLFGMLVILFSLKPLLLGVVWPLREQSDSMRGPAVRIDSVVPAAEVVTVLGRHELPDVAFYSARRFRFLREAAGPNDIRERGSRYCLVRASELADFGLQEDITPEFGFDRADRHILLIDVSGHSTTSGGGHRRSTEPDG